MEDQKTNIIDKETPVSTPAPENKKMPFKKTGGFRKTGGARRGKKFDKPKDEFEQRIVDLARVTRVMAGGKRMKFRACMVVGDKKGRVGIGVAKGADVSMAISKSVTKAKKNLIEIPIIDGTIPHQVEIRQNSARLMIRPAKQGSGIKAGGVLRIVLELAGIKDAVAKMLGTNNKVNNAKAALTALNSFVPQARQAAKNANRQPMANVKPRLVKKPLVKNKQTDNKK